VNRILIPIWFVLVLASCGTQDVCDQESQSILVARFRTLEDGQISDTILQGISVFGIRSGESMGLLYDSVNAGKIGLPLDPAGDFSRFVLFSGEHRDTLVLSHSSEAYLISYNCGFAARFKLEGFSHSGDMIVDMELISASVDAELENDEEHLWIYF
jgi:hypothetical protein